jgi:hypothetical protein
MNPDFIILLGAILSLGVAGYYFYLAFDQARPWFPEPFQEEDAARKALDTFIWTKSVPASARRNYLRFHVYGCVGFACFLFLVVEHHSPIYALLFGAVGLNAMAATLRCWLKVRRQP